MAQVAPKSNKASSAKAGGGLPSIYRDAQRLVVLSEQAVRGFARYHKYTLGAELRTQAYSILRAVHAAWFDRAFALLERLQSLAACIDQYKISLQIAKQMEWARGCVTRQALAFEGYPRFTVKAKREELEQLRAVLASYWGHFSHADSWQLRLALWDQFPWLYGMARPVQTAANVLSIDWHASKFLKRSIFSNSSAFFTHTFSVGETPCVH